MKIIPLTKQYKKQWDKIVYESNESWFFHFYDWGMFINQEILGNKLLSFLIEDNKQILGIFPLFLKRQKIFPFVVMKILSSGFGTGGLALINGLGEQHVRKIQKFTFDYIDSLAKQYKADLLEINLPPLSPANLPPMNKKINPLIFYGLKDNSTATYLIDLQNNSYEELWKKMETRSRTAIRKAEQSNITIEKVGTIDDIREYYDLHCQTYKRTGVAPHPFLYFETIFKKGWANMFFARYDKRIIAAVNVAAFKTGAVYWTSASDYRYSSLGANNLLQWHAIRWAKEQGYKWYDSGEAWLDTNNPKLAGLTRFKGSFGGELFPFYKGEKIYNTYKLQILGLLRNIKHFIKNFLH